MIAVTEHVENYLTSFAELEKSRELPGQESGFGRIRKEALDCFAELGFPTTRNEDWKYTNVTPIANTAFQTARETPRGAAIIEEIARLPFADLECPRLVFVNGSYCRELSTLGSLPPGLTAVPLTTAFSEHAQLLERHLARYASFEKQGFVALNTAFLLDGAFVHVPKCTVVGKPIHLLFVTVEDGKCAVSFPRNLILVDRESQATFIEAYISIDGRPEGRKSKIETGDSAGSYFTNAVTEIVVGEGAVVHHAKLQQESERAFHIATVQVQQERSSNVTNHSIALGAALDREDVNVVLGGEGAENSLNGLYVVAGLQHVDNHTIIDHAKPHCNSREVYKGVLDGKAQGVFNGKILVRKDAQKTDAKQSNKNLLLSEDAVINTKPQLEIYADDVKCTHGATVGQIDPESVFYLRSRGIGMEEARRLLTYAFANDVLGRINYAPLRDRLKDALFARLARSAAVRP